MRQFNGVFAASRPRTNPWPRLSGLAGPAGREVGVGMFDVIAGWFAVGMFVAGCWIVLGSFLPVSQGPARGGRDRGG